MTKVVDDGVTEYETEVVSGHQTLATRGRVSERLDELLEETISSQKVGNKWSHTLVTSEADDKQERASFG